MLESNILEIFTFLAAIGGAILSQLERFIKSTEDIRKAVAQKKVVLSEETALHMCSLIKHAKSLEGGGDIGRANLLRGDDREEPDLVLRVVESVSKHANDSRSLAFLQSMGVKLNRLLFGSILFMLIMSVVSVLVPDELAKVLRYLLFGSLALELAAIIALYVLTERLDNR